eukprot:gene37-37_t
MKEILDDQRSTFMDELHRLMNTLQYQHETKLGQTEMDWKHQAEMLLQAMTSTLQSSTVEAEKHRLIWLNMLHDFTRASAVTTPEDDKKVAPTVTEYKKSFGVNTDSTLSAGVHTRDINTATDSLQHQTLSTSTTSLATENSSVVNRRVQMSMVRAVVAYVRVNVITVLGMALRKWKSVVARERDREGYEAEVDWRRALEESRAKERALQIALSSERERATVEAARYNALTRKTARDNSVVRTDRGVGDTYERVDRDTSMSQSFLALSRPAEGETSPPVLLTDNVVLGDVTRDLSGAAAVGRTSLLEDAMALYSSPLMQGDAASLMEAARMRAEARRREALEGRGSEVVIEALAKEIQGRLLESY